MGNTRDYSNNIRKRVYFSDEDGLADVDERPSHTSTRLYPTEGHPTQAYSTSVRSQRRASDAAPITARQGRPREQANVTIDRVRGRGGKTQHVINSDPRRYRDDIETYDDNDLREVNVTHRTADQAYQVQQLQRPWMPVRRKVPGTKRSFFHMTWKRALGLAFIIALLLWILSEQYTLRVSDPATYGPAHGQVVSGVFGGGDSASQPSKIYSINDDGQIIFVKLTADNASKAVITKVGYVTNPNDEIALQVGDFNHDGHEDLKVIVEKDTFAAPWNRDTEPFIYVGDGKGNLKLQPRGN